MTSCLMESAQIIIQGTKQHSSEQLRAKKLKSFKVQAEATFQGLLKKLPSVTSEELESMQEDLDKYAAKHKLANPEQP